MDMNAIRDCFYFLNHSYYSRVHPRRRLILRKFNPSLLHVKVKCADCGTILFKCNAKRCAIPKLLKPADPHYTLIKNIMRLKPIPGNRNFKDYICPDCYDQRVRKERLLMSRKSFELTEKFSDLLSSCEKMGVCDVLSVHHELLLDDPERLKTEFLLGLICKRGEGGKR